MNVYLVTCVKSLFSIALQHVVLHCALYCRYGQFLFLEPPGTKYAPVSKSIALWNYTAFIHEYQLEHKLASNFFKAEY